MKANVLTILALAILSITGVMAQEVPVTHFMHLNPYQFYSNPTADLPYKNYIAIPLLGNVSAGFHNNALKYDKIFERDENGYPTTITANEFVNSLAKYDNTIAANVNEEILGFGLRVKKKYFLSFSYRVRANAELSFSKDLPGFFISGNMAYLGDDNEADMRLGLQGSAYQEISVGFQHKINEHWTWGTRPKLLFGAFNATTQQLQIRVHTNPDDYTLTINHEGMAHLASCLPITMNLNNGNYDFEFGDYNHDVIKNAFRNAGSAIDLGVCYNPTSKIGISLSVIDLGFIRWKANTYEIESSLPNREDNSSLGSLQFSGLTNEDIETIITDGGVNTLLDSLADYFPLSSMPGNAYTAMLHTRLQAQFGYTITPSNRLSVLAYGSIYNNRIHPALTIAYNGSFFKIIDLCLAYTLQKNSFSNLAIGLGFNLGPINIYATTHNLLPVFNHTNLSKVTANVGLVVNWGGMKQETRNK